MTAVTGTTNEISRGVEVRIRGVLPSLTSAERRVAEQVLADPGRTVHSTIGELAERSRTSLTTVTRFCRAVDLAGYAELRLALASDAAAVRSHNWEPGAGAEIERDDPLERVLASLVAADTRALEETAGQLDLITLEKAVSVLAEARRIAVYAVSGSGSVAQDLYRRLHHIGRTCHLWIDVHDAVASAALLERCDAAVGVSHSGETREVIEPLGLARRRGATTIAITNFPRSPVTEVADLLLTTAARETTYRSGSLSARHAQMLVLDCLAIGVAQRTSTASEQAVTAATNAVRKHRIPSGRGRS
ncbi:MAG: MurR/RpiR family transcriptional regulator [Nocardioidaceae bacterium]